MKKYRIIASCDPYNARNHYRGQEVVEYTGKTPTLWVFADNLTLDEARERIAEVLEEASDNNVRYDDAIIAEWRAEGDRCEWYVGAGVYDANEKICLFGFDEMSAREDVIEETGDE